MQVTLLFLDVQGGGLRADLRPSTFCQVSSHHNRHGWTEKSIQAGHHTVLTPVHRQPGVSPEVAACLPVTRPHKEENEESSLSRQKGRPHATRSVVPVDPALGFSPREHARYPRTCLSGPSFLGL